MDTKLINKAVKGNKKAFDQLIRSLSHEGYRLAYYYLQHHSDSQDALGSAIEKAYKNMTRLQDTKKFKSWFMSIVVNEAKMILRRSSSSNIISFEDVFVAAKEENDSDLVLDLEKALSRLNEENRSLLMMKYYEGYTFKEISIALGIPESTVKTRNYSLLEKLKSDLLGKEQGYV